MRALERSLLGVRDMLPSSVGQEAVIAAGDEFGSVL
jgi:hypothetical protein